MSDEEILKLYRSGERERAFGELVGSYSERLYWHVRGLVGNHEDADDLLQDIFVKVWGALDGFRGDSQLFTWLFRIATNESLNFLRKRNLRQALGLEARGVAAPTQNGLLSVNFHIREFFSVVVYLLADRARLRAK